MPQPNPAIDKAIQAIVTSQFALSRGIAPLVGAILLALREIKSLTTKVHDLQAEVETPRGDVDGLSCQN